MNPEIKDEWITALESGEYRQESTYLHTPDGYCVLGVLGDIAVRHGVAKWEPLEEAAGCPCGGCDARTFTYFSLRANDESHEGQSGHLPASVREWAGLTVEDERALWEDNDEGMTFPHLAITIKEHL